MNNVQLAGRIGTDITITDLKAGKRVAEFRLATGSGDYTDWHTVKVWDKGVETVEKFLEKGSYVVIPAGRNKEETWEKDGQKRSKVTVNCQFVELGPKPPARDNDLGI